MKALPAPLSSGSSLPISFHRRRKKQSQTTQCSMTLIFHAAVCSCFLYSSWSLMESVLRAEAKPTDLTIISQWAYWHTCFHLTFRLSPLCEGHLHLSAQATLMCVIREDDMITQVENTLYRRTGIELREFKSKITIYCRASNDFLSTSGCFWPTVKLLLAVSFTPPALSQNTSSQSQQGCVNANNGSTQSPVLC